MTLADPSPVDTKPKRRRPRGAKVLVITGLVLVVAAVVGGRAGLHRAQGAADDIREDADDVRAGFLAEIPIPGHQGVELQPGTYTVYAVRSYDTSFRTTLPGTPVTDGTATTVPSDDDPDIDVEVTRADGTGVITSDPGLDAVLSGLSGDFYGIVDFEAETAGTYDIAGSGTGAREIAVGPAQRTGNVSRFISGGLFAALGFLVGGIGFILAVAGGIWFLVAGDGAPKAGPGGLLPPGPGGWGPAPGWGPPPGAARPPGVDPAAAWGSRPGWTPPPQLWGQGQPGPWGAPPGARPPGVDPRPPPPAPPPPPPPSPSGDPVVDREQAGDPTAVGPEPGPRTRAWVPPPGGPLGPAGAAEPTRPAPWGDSPPLADDPPPGPDRT